MLRHPQDGGARVQKDHIVVPDQLRGVPGRPVFLLCVKPALGLHVQLLAVELAAGQYGAAVDLAQLALSGQRGEVSPDGGLRRAGHLTEIRHRDSPPPGQLRENTLRALFRQHGSPPF